MKTLKFYEITKEDYENTNYRPLGAEIDEIETEDGWNYGDIIENNGDGYLAAIIKETANMIIWKVISIYDGNDTEQYIVEIK